VGSTNDGRWQADAAPPIAVPRVPPFRFAVPRPLVARVPRPVPQGLLMLYLVLLWWDGALRKTWFVSWLALAMALEFYTFNEAFVDMTAVWAGGLAIGCLVAGRGARFKVLRLAGLTAVAYLVAIALTAPYLIYALRHSAASLTRQNNIYSLHLVRLVLPSSDKLFGLAPLVAYSNRIGRTALEDYVGLPLLLVLLALTAFA
jgi:hypothetical protein